MENLKLYRRRLIPDECILLKDDILLHADRDRILTRWRTLHPKPDLHHGLSCYFLKEGYKVSKFCREDDSLLYWYCDIVDYSYDSAEHSLTVTDLLADVMIYPDGFVRVVDLNEFTEALDLGLLDVPTLKRALTRLDSLLRIIYAGSFHNLQKYIENPVL